MTRVTKATPGKTLQSLHLQRKNDQETGERELRGGLVLSNEDLGANAHN